MLKLNFTKIYVAFLPIFFLFGILCYAQEDLKDKVKSIEGDIDKVTIIAGGEEYTFEGDDAKALFKKMKSGLSGSHSYTWHTNNNEFEHHNGKLIFIDEDGNKKVIEIGEDDDEDINVFISKDINMDKHGIEKKIKVEVEDGNKKVTVTTTENGEEKTEVYEGEEADEFLKNMKEEHGDGMIMKFDKDGDHKKMKKIIIETEVEEETDED